MQRFYYKAIKNLNRSTTSKEIESLVKNFPKKKIPEIDGFTGELYQIFKEVTPILLFKTLLLKKLREAITSILIL